MMWSISFFNSFCFTPRLRLFEITRVLVRLDHVASFIVNANHNTV
jgi:hypothetical protein